MKICSHCNTSVSDEYKYCLQCGRVLEPSSAQREEPLPTLVYQGEIAQPSVPPTIAAPITGSTTATNSRFRWLPWVLVLACIFTIVVLVVIIASQRRSSVAESVAQPHSEEQTQTTPTEPSPTTTSSQVALNSTPTPTSSVSPQEKKQTTPTPTPLQADPVLVPPIANTPTPTPTPSSTPTPQPVVTDRIYSNREVTERARILSKPKPVYTDSARQNQITGIVVLRVVLKSDGTIGNITVISGLSYGLTEQAIAAARNIKFTPAQKDGVLVSTSVQVEYVFNLY